MLLRVIAGALLLVLLLALLITYVPLGPGSLEDGIGPISVELHRGKINASNQLSSATSTMHNGSFATRRILLTCDNNHPIFRGAVSQLADQLRQLPFIDTVDVVDSLDALPQRRQLHDVYLTIRVPELTISGLLLTGRRVEASVEITMSPHLAPSRHHHTDHLAPPGVHYEYNGNLQHQSTTQGYQSAHARYTLVAENIANAVGEQLTNSLVGVISKHGAAGDIPADFFPAYRPPPDDLPLPGIDRRLLLSGHGHLLYNRTIWQLQTDSPEADLTRWRDDLEETGWKISASALDDDRLMVRATAHGAAQVLEAYEPADSLYAPTNQAPVLLHIVYHDRMTPADLEPIVDQKLKTDSALIDLLPYRSYFTAEQRRQLIGQFLQASPPVNAKACLELARLLHQESQTEQALTLLQAADIYDRLSTSDLESQINAFAKQITGEESWEAPPVDEAVLARLGFIHVPASGVALEADRMLDAPLLLHHPGDHNRPDTLYAICVRKSNIPEGPYTLSTRHTVPPNGGHGFSDITPHTNGGTWTARNISFLNVAAQETTPRQFHFTVTGE